MNSQKYLNALEHYLEMKGEHDAARASYKGYSWGYYGQPWVDRMETAQKEFDTALKEYIDEIVKQGIEASLIELHLVKRRT